MSPNPALGSDCVNSWFSLSTCCSFPQIWVGKAPVRAAVHSVSSVSSNRNQLDLPLWITMLSVLSIMWWKKKSVINLLSEVCTFIFWRRFFIRSHFVGFQCVSPIDVNTACLTDWPQSKIWWRNNLLMSSFLRLFGSDSCLTELANEKLAGLRLR